MAGFVEVFILFALLYWLFYPRVYQTATSMVDILAGTFQKVYSKWDSLSKSSITELTTDRTGMSGRITVSSLDRLGGQTRKDQRLGRKKVTVKQIERTIFEELPLEVKRVFEGDEVAVKVLQPYANAKLDKTRPIMGLACKKCISSVSNSLVGRVSQQYAIQNVLSVDTLDKGNGYLTQFFCHIVSAWRQKVHNYPKVYSTVLEDERLKEAISTAADNEYKEVEIKDDKVYQKLLKNHENRALKIIDDMRTSISDFLLKTMAWLVYKLIPRFIMSVSTHPAQIEMLKSAGESGLPLIFLPLHRSHLDYILITFILLCNDIQAPLVASGDNLKIPFFGWLLRSLGAFFIKRRMDPVQGRRDTVYRAVLHTYMMECLRAGHNIEFFIEGGRTRTGKPCMPKGGLLSVIVDAYMDGTISDALLVPVSLNYDKLVDGHFVREQMGQPKEMETFGNAIRAIYKVLNSNYGMMRIDFHQPFSLMDLVKSFQSTLKRGGAPPMLVDPRGDGRLTVRERADTFHQTPSSASLYGTDICHEEHRNMVESIARHVIYDCTKATAVMSTNAVALLLLYKFRNGVSLSRLVASLDELRAELMWVNRDVGFSGESVDVINHAVDILGPALVRREKQLVSVGDGLDTQMITTITPITMLPNVIELSYYSNTLLPHYVIDSVIVTAIYSLVGDAVKNAESEETLYVQHDQLIQNALLICDILQYEFIFAKPCQDVEDLLLDAIDRLKMKGVLLLEEELEVEDSEEVQWSKRYSRALEEGTNDYSDEEDAPDKKSVEYKLLRDRAMFAHLEFLHSLLRPLIDVYTVSALCLSRLVDRQLTEQELVKEILGEVETLLDREFVLYGESMAVDPIKCSLKLFEHWRALECHTVERIKLYYLPEKYDRESEVRKIFEMVNQFKFVPGPKYDVNQVYEDST